MHIRTSHFWNQTSHLLNYNWCHVQQLLGCRPLSGVPTAEITSESPQSWALKEKEGQIKRKTVLISFYSSLKYHHSSAIQRKLNFQLAGQDKLLCIAVYTSTCLERDLPVLISTHRLSFLPVLLRRGKLERNVVVLSCPSAVKPPAQKNRNYTWGRAYHLTAAYSVV